MDSSSLKSHGFKPFHTVRTRTVEVKTIKTMYKLRSHFFSEFLGDPSMVRSKKKRYVPH